MANQKQTSTNAKIRMLMYYLNLVWDNGELDLFVALFQTDYRIMTYLSSHPGSHPSKMAEDLKVTRSNIAANLRLLEQKRYIAREINDENRRQVFVSLTKEGKQYLSLCESQLTALLRRWFDILGEEETDHLLKILELSSKPELMTPDLKEFSFGE